MGGLCFRQWPGQPVDLRDLTACRWFAMDRYRKRPVSGPQDRGPVGVAETSGSWQNPSARRAFGSRWQPLAWHGRLRCRPPRRARRHARVVPEGTRTRGRIPRLAGCGPVATSILIHELTHLRRRDALLAGLQAVVVRIFWFDPVVWLLNRSLRVEMEKSCDEAVLDVTADAKVYAGG